MAVELLLSSSVVLGVAACQKSQLPLHTMQLMLIPVAACALDDDKHLSQNKVRTENKWQGTVKGIPVAAGAQQAQGLWQGTLGMLAGQQSRTKRAQ